MADTIAVTCPNCTKLMQVPLAVAGKRIKCRSCQTVVAVPAAKTQETFGLAPDESPKKAKPKPAAKPTPAPLPPAAKNPKYDDLDEDANPFGVQKDDLDIPRCPFCADELDPPDTNICMTCGYDLVQRRRHESKKVYHHTRNDYIKHLLPGVGAVIGLGLFVTIIVVSLTMMSDLFIDMDLQDDQENKITGKKGFIVPPGACSLPIIVASLFGIYKCGYFAIKRLAINWKPPEFTKQDDEK